MDASQAFQVLEVPQTASVDDVHRAFRRLAPQMHPDGTGTSQDFVVLNTARDSALEFIRNRDVALTPQVARAMVEVRRTIIEVEQHRDAARAVARRAILARVRRLHAFKRASWFFASLAAFTALLNALLASGVVVNGLKQPNPTWLTLPLVIIAGVLAQVGILYRERADEWERNTEIVSDTLALRQRFFAAIREIFGGTWPPPFTRDVLHERIDQWIRSERISGLGLKQRAAKFLLLGGDTGVKSVAAALGADDFADHLIAVGRSREYLSESVTISDGVPDTTYHLNWPSSQ